MVKSVLEVVLCVGLTGCNPQWLSTKLVDLPVLTQMALNIAALVSTLSGQQVRAAEAVAIRNISAEATRDLNLQETLYRDYKADPSQNALRPALLQAGHISNAALAARVTAAVNLILTTVNGFNALMPQSRLPRARQAGIPSAKQLKQQRNQQVCTNSGSLQLDDAFAACRIR